MLKNYLLTTFRNFARNRTYTVINMAGLSIGITACILIFLSISNDLSFDTFHSKYERIYRVVQETRNSDAIEYGSVTPYPFTDAFRNDFPDVPLITQMHRQNGVMVAVGAERLPVDHVLFADSLFFRVFDFQVLSGNPAADLAQPGKVFLTKTLADKILKGNTRSIRVDNKLDLDVAGILADPPPNSHIDYDMIISMPSLTSEFVSLPIDRWGMTMSGYNYLVLPRSFYSGDIEERLKDFASKYLTEKDDARKSFHLQPLRSIHFDPQYTENPGSAANVNKRDLLVMGMLGVFILALACVNFINLSTALAVKKSKEVGIRKTLGAGRSQLIAYFLGETFLLTLFSVILSLCFSEWLLKWMNTILSTRLEMHLWSNPPLQAFLVALVVLTSLLAGFYPSIILSGYNPLTVLKNKLSAQKSSSTSVRKVLVVFQFLIAQILIMGTLVMAYQMQYFRQKPLGFDSDMIITVPLPENNKKLRASFKARLQDNPGIQSISLGAGAPTSDNSISTSYFLSERGEEERYKILIKGGDRGYMETFGLRLKEGRWFSERDKNDVDTSSAPFPPTEGDYEYIINETAAKQLGFSNSADILGKKITTGINSINAEVIGVVKDFHTASLHDPIPAVLLMDLPYFYYEAGIKINGGNVTEVIADIEKAWTPLFPDYTFQYEFLDQHLANMYKHDDQTFTMFKVFAGVSIFIGCLGLFGLISFLANQKLKEVGIRKVLGASAGSILILFSTEFVKLVVIAFFVAAPIAFYFMNQWLNGFAYRIDIPWTVYVIGLMSTLIIALATVSYRSLQAASTNPAETLRTE